MKDVNGDIDLDPTVEMLIQAMSACFKVPRERGIDLLCNNIIEVITEHNRLETND